jgi:hypothetical protein
MPSYWKSSLSISQYSYFGLGNPVKTLGNLFWLDSYSLEVVRASMPNKNATTTGGMAQMKRLMNAAPQPKVGIYRAKTQRPQRKK